MSMHNGDPIFNQNPKLVLQLKDVNSLIAYLKKHATCDYFRKDKGMEWIKNEWISIEKSKEIYPIFENGAGDCTFFCVKDHTIWDYDHESATFMKIDYFNKHYTLTDPYLCAREFILEVYDEEIFGHKYASPYRIHEPVKVSNKSAYDKWKDAALLTFGGIVLGGAIASVPGAIAGGIAGAALAYKTFDEDGCSASISGIAPVAPMQTKVQSTAFSQTAFSEDDNDVDDEFSLSLMLKL